MNDEAVGSNCVLGLDYLVQASVYYINGIAFAYIKCRIGFGDPLSQPSLP